MPAHELTTDRTQSPMLSPQKSTANNPPATPQERIRTARSVVAILQALKAIDENAKENAWVLMNTLTSATFPSENGSQFYIEKYIKEAKEFVGGATMREAKKMEKLLEWAWNFRHYTGNKPESKPPYSEIQSAYDLSRNRSKDEETKQKGNTDTADWKKVGSVGFTFFLISINGKVSNRDFLKTAYWYLERELDDVNVPDCWFSGDLLSTLGVAKDTKAAGVAMTRAVAFRGSGSDIKKALALLAVREGAAISPELTLKLLDRAVGGSLELKLPTRVSFKESDPEEKKWQKKGMGKV